MQDKSNLSKIVDAVFPAASGIRSPRGITLAYRILPHEVAERLHAFKAPFVVKPSFSGSSDGLCVKDTHLDAAIAANTMLEKEGKVLIQELERQVAHEVSCTVLDQPYGPNFLPIIEIRRDDVAVFGVEEKFGAQSLGRHIIPARIDSAVSKRIEQAVITLHREIGSIGLTRTDILVLKNGEIVILEVNGIPGLLTSSIACDAAQAAGISFEELCILYAQSAYIRRAEPDVWGGLV
jgi:D-alanine-D-alanine ligase